MYFENLDEDPMESLKLGAGTDVTFPVVPGQVVGLWGGEGSRVLILPLTIEISGGYEFVVDLSDKSFIFQGLRENLWVA